MFLNFYPLIAVMAGLLFIAAVLILILVKVCRKPDRCNIDHLLADQEYMRKKEAIDKLMADIFPYKKTDWVRPFKKEAGK